MDNARYSRRGVAASLAATLGLCATSSIAGNMSLTITGIAAPIEVLSFQVGATNSASVSPGGGAGKVNYQDVTFVAPESAAAPLQLLWVSTGQHQQRATLQVLTPALTPMSEWIFEDFAVSSVSLSGSGVDKPRVVLSLQYNRITYRVFGADGGVAQQMCWNIPSNIRC